MLLSVLVALTVIMVTARVVGALFKRLHQPAVIGEVVGGILLGPSLLGRLSPETAAVLLPSEAAPFLGVIAQLGVILYMFMVGLELDLTVLRSRVAITVVISIESIVREMLKPMLKEWLDQNLPALVQKMVERELEKLSKRV